MARAQDVAEYFIALAKHSGDTSVTNLKIQKLVYYAQAWYLANFDKPLFEEDFQAWVHGPVIPELYQQYKEFSYKPIDINVTLDQVEPRFKPEELEFLKEVAKVYMPSGGYELELMTHNEDPWKIARGSLAPEEHSDKVISKDSMFSYYSAVLENGDQEG